MNVESAVSNDSLEHGISQSKTIAEISKALFKVQSQLLAVTKDADNKFFSSKYATLHAVWQELQPLMKDAGLTVIQSSGDALPVNALTESKGQPVEKTVFFMDFYTRVTHSETGEWIQSVSKFPLGKIDPQGFGSATTYARRYCLSALMGIVVDDDDDGNAGSGKANQSPSQNRNASQPAQQRQTQQKTTGQQQNKNPPSNEQKPQTTVQKIGAFLTKAGCKGKDDANLVIDFIAPSQTWESVQNKEIAKFVGSKIGERLKAGDFTVEGVLKLARAAADADNIF